MEYENVKWGSFILSEIFNIESTNSGIDKNKIKNLNIKGKMPYITRSDKSNGYDLFITQQDYELNEGNVITIGLDTQTVFYQPHSFYTGQNVQILSNGYLNKYNSLFIVTLLKIVLDKFNWGGNGATLTRLRNSRILMPINDDGEPNYEFMESFMRVQEKELIRKYCNYLNSRLSPEMRERERERELDLKNRNWLPFTLDKLGDILSGKDIYEEERVIGDIPYISAKAMNNGIGYFVGNMNNTFESNCISVNRNGSVGHAFFHPYNALFSNDCRKFKLNEFSDNKYVSLFISTQIKAQKERYSYGYKLGTARLKKQQIMLPVNDDNEPDYKYMEQYMVNLELKLLTKYLNYLSLN